MRVLSEQEMRVMALDHAVTVCGHGAREDAVASMADRLYRFLISGDVTVKGGVVWEKATGQQHQPSLKNYASDRDPDGSAKE